MQWNGNFNPAKVAVKFIYNCRLPEETSAFRCGGFLWEATKSWLVAYQRKLPHKVSAIFLHIVFLNMQVLTLIISGRFYRWKNRANKNPKKNLKVDSSAVDLLFSFLHNFKFMNWSVSLENWFWKWRTLKNMHHLCSSPLKHKSEQCWNILFSVCNSCKGWRYNLSWSYTHKQ